MIIGIRTTSCLAYLSGAGDWKMLFRQSSYSSSWWRLAWRRFAVEAAGDANQDAKWSGSRVELKGVSESET